MIAIIEGNTVTEHTLPYLIETPEITAPCQSYQAIRDLTGLDARDLVTHEYDPATHKLTTGNTLDDFDITETTVSRKVVAKSAEEIEADRLAYNAQMNELRRQAFTLEADPLYLDEKEFAVTENREPVFTAWLAKKQEIRARYPYREV